MDADVETKRLDTLIRLGPPHVECEACRRKFLQPRNGWKHGDRWEDRWEGYWRVEVRESTAPISWPSLRTWICCSEECARGLRDRYFTTPPIELEESRWGWARKMPLRKYTRDRPKKVKWRFSMHGPMRYFR